MLGLSSDDAESMGLEWNICQKEGGAGAGQRDMQSRSFRALEANEVILLWVEGHFLL